MIIEINERLGIGGMQSRRSLEQAMDSGYETIVDLRAHDELSPSPPRLGPVTEQQACCAIGLRYVNVATKPGAFGVSTSRSLRSAVANGGKVLVHCTTGIRAAWLGLMCLVCEGTIPFAEYFAHVDELGVGAGNAARLRESCIAEIIRASKSHRDRALSPHAWNL